MIYFDLETTGLLLPPQADQARQPRIVQAAWAVDDGPVRVQLCDPGVSIPKEASRIHGITDAMVHGKQSERGLVTELLWLLCGSTGCAYNAGFDLTVLAHAATRYGTVGPNCSSVIDPMLVGEDRFGTRFKLVDLHEKLLGVKPETAHDAAADVESLRRVWKELSK